ncbi:hypothetical protein [Pseudoruminococcus massiliensis]|uniref:hypothetical protein n=1 Tax=Pseudoruminococcus massiliensis TaxID=2086583 RepID=UPI003FD885F7
MSNIKIKKVTKKNKSIKSAVKKMQKITFVASIIATIMVMSTMTAFATPSGANTTTMNSLIGIVMWVVRGAILFIGAIPALIKVVQGQQNEDARERNGGLVGIAIAGVAIGATFAVEPLLSSF